MPWPEEALSRVGMYFVNSMHLNRPHDEENEQEQVAKEPAEPGQEEVRRETTNEEREMTQLESDLVYCVMYFHQSVVDASEKCFLELNRRNYVTPSAYLELLKAFRTFYSRKLDEITRLRDRYTTGLEKLDFAAGQVGEMQTNLYDLQPKLKVLSEETDRIMVNIERETAEAEKRRRWWAPMRRRPMKPLLLPRPSRMIVRQTWLRPYPPWRQPSRL